MDIVENSNQITNSFGVLFSSVTSAVVYGDTSIASSSNLTTWGLTASVCIEVACAVLDRPTEFDYYFDVPLLPADPFVYRRRSLVASTKMMTGDASRSSSSKL